MKFIKRAFGTVFVLFLGLVILGAITGDGARTANDVATEQLTEEERTAKIAALDARVRGIPASDVAENLRLYRELQTLDPSSERYKRKVAFYRERQAEARNRERYPERYVDLTEFSWRKEALGNVMIADFTIENSLSVRVKDIEVKCTHSAPSGTVIDSNRRTIYDYIGPKEVKTFRDFNMGFIHSQAQRSRCSVVGVTVEG